MKYNFLILFSAIILCQNSLAQSQYKYKLIAPIQSDSLYYKDSLVEITLRPDEYQLNFTLKNLTEGMIKVNWDECALIIIDESKPAIHAGIKYIDRDKSMPPTIIPGGTRINEMLVGKSYIKYGYNNWDVEKMYRFSYFSTPESTFPLGCFLSLITANGKKEYYFKIQISKIDKIKVKKSKKSKE